MFQWIADIKKKPLSLKGHPDFKPLEQRAAQHKNSQIPVDQTLGQHRIFFSFKYATLPRSEPLLGQTLISFAIST